MTLQPAGRSERGTRRARGDGLVWLAAGVVLILIGWLAGWTLLVLLGVFVALPALIILILIRRDGIRRDTPPRRPRE